MEPNTNSDPAATSATTPTSPTAPTAEPSSEEVKITKKDWQRVQSALGRIENLQRENEALKGGKTDQQPDMRRLLERAHTLGAQDKPFEEVLSQIQNEQTDQEYRAAVMTIAQALRDGGTLPAGPGTTPGVNIAQALADYKLDPKDTYVAAQLQGKQFASQTEAELFAARLFRDKSLTPNPNPAQQPTSPGSALPGGLTPEEVERKSTLLARLYDNYSKNKPQIDALEKELADHWAKQTQT